MATVKPDGMRIRARRALLDLTQQELAWETGYSKRTIERAEAGIPVKPDVVKCIAGALDLELSDSLAPEEPFRIANLLDVRTYRTLLNYAGCSHEQLCEKLGIPEGELDLNNLISAAAWLRANFLDTLRAKETPTPKTYWHNFGFFDLANLVELDQRQNDSSWSIVFTQGFETFFQPQGMMVWSFEETHRVMGWTDEDIRLRVEKLKATDPAKRQRRRKKSNCRSTVVLSDEFLWHALSKNEGWYDATKNRIEDLKNNTRVVFVPFWYWEKVSRRIGKLVEQVTGFPRWDKVAVFESSHSESSLSLIRPTRDQYYVSYNWRNGQWLRQGLEECLNGVTSIGGFEWPPRRPRVDDSRDTRTTIGHIQKILQRLENQKLNQALLEQVRLRKDDYWLRLSFQDDLPPIPDFDQVIHDYEDLQSLKAKKSR